MRPLTTPAPTLAVSLAGVAAATGRRHLGRRALSTRPRPTTSSQPSTSSSSSSSSPSWTSSVSRRTTLSLGLSRRHVQPLLRVHVHYHLPSALVWALERLSRRTNGRSTPPAAQLPSTVVPCLAAAHPSAPLPAQAQADEQPARDDEQGGAPTSPWWWEGVLKAVPKKKVSHSRKAMRSANKGLKDRVDLVHCPSCGRAKLAHHVCASCYGEISRVHKRASSSSTSAARGVGETTTTAEAKTWWQQILERTSGKRRSGTSGGGETGSAGEAAGEQGRR